eukprot:170793-Prorocentrum_minimum.AAC.1
MRGTQVALRGGGGGGGEAAHREPGGGERGGRGQAESAGRRHQGGCQCRYQEGQNCENGGEACGGGRLPPTEAESGR